MKTMALMIAAIGEAATGLLLLAHPPIVVRLLFGAELADTGIVMSRLAGIALFALGLSCWPGRTALCGMLTYNALATGYLAWLGIHGEWVGALLWPAVALHAAMTLLLGRVWIMSRRNGGPKQPNR